MIHKCLTVRTIIAAVTLYGLGIVVAEAYCQESHEHDHAHDTKNISLGTSVGYAHLTEEDEYAFGFHLHLMKSFGDRGLRQHFSLGLAAETIFADHTHYAAMIPLEIYPYQGLVLSIAPGIVWVKHEAEWESTYSTHMEAAYTFEFNKYDIGPVVGYSRTDDDEHYMIGVHVGLHL